MDSAGERLWLRFFWQNAKVVDMESWTASGFRVQGIAIAIPGRRCSRVADRGSGLWIKEAVSAVHVLTYGGGMYCRLMDMDNVEGGRRRGICKGLHPCAPSANAHSPAPRSWWFV
jgi:hypothetical protein